MRIYREIIPLQAYCKEVAAVLLYNISNVYELISKILLLRHLQMTFYLNILLTFKKKIIECIFSSPHNHP